MYNNTLLANFSRVFISLGLHYKYMVKKCYITIKLKCYYYQSSKFITKLSYSMCEKY